MKRILLFLIICSISLIINAQNLKKGFKLIEKENYAEATAFFNNYKSNCIAKAGLVKILIKSDKLKSESELINAYICISDIKQCYEDLDQKTKNKYLKVISKTDINQFYEKIDKSYYSYVIAKNKTSIYDTYLSNCKNSPHFTEVLIKADNRKFADACEKFTIILFQDYLSKYPEGINTKKAKENIAMIEEFEAIKTIEECKTFLSKYQEKRLIGEVESLLERLIYEDAIQIASTESLNKYLELYPFGVYNKQVSRKVEDLSFEKAKKEMTLNSLSNFKTKYPNSIHNEEINEILENYLDVKYKASSVFLYSEQDEKGNWILPKTKVRWGKNIKQFIEASYLGKTKTCYAEYQDILFTLDERGKVDGHIVLYSYLGCPFKIKKEFEVTKWLKSEKVIQIKIEDIIENICILPEDCGLPWANQGKGPVSFGNSFPINTKIIFLKKGLKFETDDFVYETLTTNSTISFTEFGVKMTGLNKEVK
jgi:hypothetical protein